MPTKPNRKKRTGDRIIDEAGAETFPASDPPAYAGGSHSIGAPNRTRTTAKHKPKSTGQTSKRKGK